MTDKKNQNTNQNNTANVGLINAFVSNALEQKKEYTHVDAKVDDNGNTESAWRFDNPRVYVLFKTDRLRYNGEFVAMNDTTKSLVAKQVEIEQRRKKRENKRNNIKEELSDFGGQLWEVSKWVTIGTVGLTLFMGILYVGVSGIEYLANKEEREIDAKVAEYKKTLPNWDDTIRIAPSDSDLTLAINKREQQRLNIERFRDSIAKTYE